MMDCNPDHIILNVHSPLQIDAFSIYPNPAGDHITLKLNNIALPNQPKMIEIFDLFGKKVLERDIKSNTTNEIRLDKLPKGIYIIVLIDQVNTAVSTQKLIIE